MSSTRVYGIPELLALVASNLREEDRFHYPALSALSLASRKGYHAARSFLWETVNAHHCLAGFFPHAQRVTKLSSMYYCPVACHPFWYLDNIGSLLQQPVTPHFDVKRVSSCSRPHRLSLNPSLPVDRFRKSLWYFDRRGDQVVPADRAVGQVVQGY